MNTPHTPLRSIRIDGDLWKAAQAAAAGNSETVSTVVRRALAAYVARSKRTPPTPKGPTS